MDLGQLLLFVNSENIGRYKYMLLVSLCLVRVGG